MVYGIVMNTVGADFLQVRPTVVLCVTLAAKPSTKMHIIEARMRTSFSVNNMSDHEGFGSYNFSCTYTVFCRLAYYFNVFTEVCLLACKYTLAGEIFTNDSL